jgi:hypothetical protein
MFVKKEVASKKNLHADKLIYWSTQFQRKILYKSYVHRSLVSTKCKKIANQWKYETLGIQHVENPINLQFFSICLLWCYCFTHFSQREDIHFEISASSSTRQKTCWEKYFASYLPDLRVKEKFFNQSTNSFSIPNIQYKTAFAREKLTCHHFTHICNY